MVFGPRGSAIQQNLTNREKVTKSEHKLFQMASQGQKVRQKAPKWQPKSAKGTQNSQKETEENLS